jgi:glyoxylase-like metal-dependent hydrolase (beta-lactamase superfamily II)/rhodanese-related sulfurtransferase
MSEPVIDVETLRTWLERGQGVTVLDVRPVAERLEWSIPGSLHIDAYEALKRSDPQALADVVVPQDHQVVTVCAAGRTSLKAAEQLRARGIAALSLAGGMQAWSLAWNSAPIVYPDRSAQIIQVRRTGKGCLSYLVASQGEAVVIDPSVDPEVYLSLATAQGWTITAVVDTHIHADHLSRARRLAERSGAALHLPAQQRVGYPFSPLLDGDTLTLGAATLVAWHTPGHTGESLCYLLDDQVLFTGDTLFLTSVGRPDLEASPEEARRRAKLLFGSLRRLLTLPPQTLVLPGHTSEPIPFDAAPIGATLAEVRQQAAILQLSEEDFIAALLTRLPPTPPNHQRIVALNESGFFPEENFIELEAGANRCAVS